MQKSLKLFDIRPDLRNYITDSAFDTKDKVGVEVELENVTENPDLRYWRCVRDGSLRENGMELVMEYPLCGYDLSESLEELDTFLKENPTITCGQRTSVHVHIDVRDISVYQLYKMLVMYLVFEETIYCVGGKERANSNFCPPLGNCVEGLNSIGMMNSVAKGYSKRRLEQSILEFGKYCGVNLNSICNFGSLEFRMHEGTKDVERITNWIKVLLKLKEFGTSRSLKVREIAPWMSMEGPATLCERVFGGMSQYLIESDPDMQEHCFNGSRNAEYCINLNSMMNYTKGFCDRKAGRPIDPVDLGDRGIGAEVAGVLRRGDRGAGVAVVDDPMAVPEGLAGLRVDRIQEAARALARIRADRAREEVEPILFPVDLGEVEADIEAARAFREAREHIEDIEPNMLMP